MTDGTTTWLFSYDGDGNRVSHLISDGITTQGTFYFMGGGFEVSSDGINQTVRKYYSIAGTTYAMSDNGTMNYLITDHLSSVVAVTDASGLLLEETRYMPFGSVRSDVRMISQTDKSFTGQKVLANTGLLDYNARFYSSELGRFTQPDTIIPGAGNSQAWNRYSYVMNNPIKFNDPSGHDQDCGLGDPYCDELKHEFGDDWRDHLDETTNDYLKRHNKSNSNKLPNGVGSDFYFNSVSGILENFSEAKYPWVSKLWAGFSIIGMLIQMTPAQIENFRQFGSNVPFNEMMADVLVDSGISLLSEMAGGLFAIGLAAPLALLFPISAPVAAGIGLLAGAAISVIVSISLNHLVQKYNIRDIAAKDLYRYGYGSPISQPDQSLGENTPTIPSISSTPIPPGYYYYTNP